MSSDGQDAPSSQLSGHEYDMRSRRSSVDLKPLAESSQFDSDSQSVFMLNEVEPNSSGSISPKKRGRTHTFSEAQKSSVDRSNKQYQCEQCGKVYKHRNCLSKHRWEHHESWEVTKRICSTKHQQVQLLEAAQVLIELQIMREQRRSRFGL